MSKVFSARFEILGNGLSQPGIFQVFANAIDPTLAGYSVTDIIVGDVFFDENIMTGDTNRYRVTQIFGTGSSSFQGAGPISIRLLAAWDDDGDFDPAGPAAGTGYISRATVHGRLAEVPAWTIFGISEPLAARVASINGRVGIAPRIGASAISKIMVSGSFDPIPTGTPVSKRVDGKIVPADSDSSTGQIYVGVVRNDCSSCKRNGPLDWSKRGGRPERTWHHGREVYLPVGERRIHKRPEFFHRRERLDHSGWLRRLRGGHRFRGCHGFDHASPNHAAALILSNDKG